MRRFFYISIFCLFLIIGCKPNGRDTGDILAENIIKITIGTSKDIVLYSDLFDSLEYIRLETADDILIKDITNLKYANEKIYILDNKTQTLFCFKKDGKLDWKINQVGHGPQEYTRLTDFDVDDKNNKLYLFSARDKILIYDLSGNFIKVYNVRFGGTSFACSKKYLYIYANNISNHFDGTESNNYLLLYDKEKDLLKGRLPFKTDKKFGTMNTYNTSDAFSRHEDEVRFFMPFSNNIYSIKEDSIYIKYQLDFGQNNMPGNYFEEYTTDDLHESKYAYGLNSFWENDKYFSFNITVDKEFYQVLYDKKVDKAYTGTLFDDISYCSPLFRTANDNYVMGSHLAEDLFLIKGFPKENSKTAILEEIISEMTEDDNPVIFFYYFKE